MRDMHAPRGGIRWYRQDNILRRSHAPRGRFILLSRFIQRRASTRGKLSMRLGYFTMPMHPAQRPSAQTLQEDREAIILADKLGFYDAFVGEHLTEKSENVTNSFIFLATLIHATKNIKLATGTSNLSHTHPTLVAAHAAMF